MKTKKIEVWVLVDNDGDHVASHDPSDLNATYDQQIRDIESADGLRRIKIVLDVILPEPVILLTGEVPLQGEATLNAVVASE